MCTECKERWWKNNVYCPSTVFQTLCKNVPVGASGKESACQCRRYKRCEFDPWVGKNPWRGNGNPFQYSCLENPTDRGAWWATAHGVVKESDTTEELNTSHHHLQGIWLQWLEAGFQFQARDWSQAGAVRALNPSHQPTRNQRPGTSFWPVSCAEMNFHIEQKVVKQVKCLLGGERVHVHRYTGGLRERVKPSWQFKSLLWNISSGFPWAIFFVAFFFCPHCLACGILVA